MNAIAKAIPQSVALTRPWIGTLPRIKTHLLLLLMGVLLSAFAILYCKDLNRRMFIDYQSQQQVTQELVSYHNNLLLESSTWSNQARIQAVAEQQLNMKNPGSKDTVIVKSA